MYQFRQAFILVILASGIHCRSTEESFADTEDSTTVAIEVDDPTSEELEPTDASLDLTNVGITRIPERLGKSDVITRLILDNNEISTISPRAFASLPKLTRLSLANNYLRRINLEVFSGYENLRVLNLNNNCNTKFVEPPIDCNQVCNRRSRYRSRFIYNDYGNTELPPTEEPRTEASLRSACSVKFASNFRSLKYLHLEDNNLESLIFSVSDFPSLTHLYLSNNSLIINRELLYNLGIFAPAMTHLYLANSGIVQFDIAMIPSLISLDLANNHLDSISTEYCDGPALKLMGASKLQTLLLQRNSITRIEPNAFDGAPNLIALDLSGNKIENIENEMFEKLSQLRYLNLENNQLSRIHGVPSFANLRNLETLLLSSNDMSHVTSSTFANLINLKKLALDYNKISNLEPGTFSDLDKLEELTLVGNSLSTISDECMPTSHSLTVLDISNNVFNRTEHLPKNFSRNLKYLIIKNNPLEAFRSDWLANLTGVNIVFQNNCSD